MTASDLSEWWPLFNALTDYPGPWYMSEWFWATFLILLALMALYWPPKPLHSRHPPRDFGGEND